MPANYSLAFQKFKKSLETEIRFFWQLVTSSIYTDRWWMTFNEPDKLKRLSEFPGDKKNPFNSVDIPVKEYLDYNRHIPVISRENSIVSFVTTFEVYLLDITKRIIFLNPEIVNDSEMPFQANDIAKALNNGNMQEWFAESVANKYMRNKTHFKMLKRIENIAKIDIFNTHKIIAQEWDKWTYVRNAIIHSGRETTIELSLKWPDKFPNPQSDLRLTDKDVVRVHFLALEIASLIDRRVVDTLILDSDGLLLARELFVRFGISDPCELSRMVYSSLNHKLGKSKMEQQLAFQKKTNDAIEGWTFSNYNFEL